MPDVARRAVHAPVDAAVGDDARPDAGGDLDEHHVLEAVPEHPVLAQRHDVHVVVDQDGHAVALAQHVGDRVAVPARHDRRADRPAGLEVDRAGQPDPERQHVPAPAAGGREQAVERRAQPVEHGVRPVADGDRLLDLGQRRAGEVAHRQAAVGRAEVGGEHDAGILVHRERGGRPPARRAARAVALHDQARREQHTDALEDGRPRQPRGGDEVAAADRDPAADEAEDDPG